MAHGFIDLGSKTTFVTKKELAWHKLGKVVDAMTSKEAIELAGMNFEVKLAPLFAGVETIKLEETYNYQNALRCGIGKLDEVSFYNAGKVEGNFASYRTDTNHIFGVVGSRYEVVQNHEAFDFFDSIIGEGNAAYETAGALGNGEKIFITAKLPNKLIVKKEDIDKYLLLTMAHDGSGSIQAMFTPIRVVCNNTLSMALGSANNKISIRHTKNARTKLDLAKKILGVVENQSNSLSEIFNNFADARIDEAKIKAVIQTSFGFKEEEDGTFTTRAANIMNDVLKYHEIGVGQEGIRGTKWGVLNAITGYQQNTKSYKDDATQFESIYNKQSANIRQKAFNTLLSI